MWSLQARQGNKQLPALFCVPFIVKDNFDTAGMAGTAGSVALLDNYPLQDAEQVRNAHAVIPPDVPHRDGYENRACLLLLFCRYLPRVSLPCCMEPWHILLMGMACPPRGCAGVEMLALRCQCSQPHLSALGR